MTVQEIFNTKAVQEIETEILNLQYETEKRRLFRDSEGFAIKSLLGIRRNILHDYFVMDEKYKLLLSEFNEALKLQLIDMRNRTIKLYESLKGSEDISWGSSKNPFIEIPFPDDWHWIFLPSCSVSVKAVYSSFAI